MLLLLLLIVVVIITTTTTTTTTTIIIIIIIIALKGAIRDFYNLLPARRTASNTYAQVVRTPSCVNHVQHIESLLRA